MSRRTAATLALNRASQNAMGKIYGGQMIYNTGKQVISAMIAQTKELDDQIRVYNKLLPEWDKGDQMTYLNELAKVGTQLGKTKSEMTEASMLLTRSGYGGTTESLQKQNKELTTQAVLLSNIADEEMSVGDAADSIVAVSKAWQVNDEDVGKFAAHYVNAVNEISNNMAVTSNDLTTNIDKMSSAMATGGNTLDQTLAMLTAQTEINRNASKSATALRTLQSRYTQIAQYTQGSTTSTGKWLYEFFEKVGIQMTDSEGQLRSFFETWNDLAKKNEETGRSVWDTLSADEKKLFLLKAAGANRSSEAAALLNNWEAVTKAIELAENAEGSALESNDAMMDSITGRVSQLSAAWQDFASQAMKSSFIKTVLIGIREAIEALNNPLGRLAVVGGATFLTLMGGFIVFKAMITLIAATIMTSFVPAIESLILLLGTLGEAFLGAFGLGAGAGLGALAAAGLVPIAALIASFALFKAAIDDAGDALTEMQKVDTSALNETKEKISDLEGELAKL